MLFTHWESTSLPRRGGGGGRPTIKYTRLDARHNIPNFYLKIQLGLPRLSPLALQRWTSTWSRCIFANVQ